MVRFPLSTLAEDVKRGLQKGVFATLDRVWRDANFFFPPQLWTPSTNSFAYSQSELHDMNMNDLRLRNKNTHARGLVILL